MPDDEEAGEIPTYAEFRRLERVIHADDELRALVERLVLAWVIDSYRHAQANEATLTDSIRAARTLGLSWEAIGRPLGMSKQSASKRFGHRIRAVALPGEDGDGDGDEA